MRAETLQAHFPFDQSRRAKDMWPLLEVVPAGANESTRTFDAEDSLQAEPALRHLRPQLVGPVEKGRGEPPWVAGEIGISVLPRAHCFLDNAGRLGIAEIA